MKILQTVLTFLLPILLIQAGLAALSPRRDLV